MRLQDVKGQQRVIHALQRSVNTGRVAHAYLFDGIEGCGRRTTACALIQVLFCLQPVAGDACGVCSSCRKLIAGNHPDLQFLSPLPDKRDISIEQIRELQQVLSLRPFEARRKACLIEPAERMNEKSANALLKTLEEPPGDAILILLTTQPDLLLSTIRSRCQHLRFSPLDDTVVAELLEQQGIERQKAAELAPLAAGSMQYAAQLDADQDQVLRRELLTGLTHASSRSIGSIFDTAETLAGNRDETLKLFDILTGLIRDLVVLRAAGESGVANKSLIKELSAESDRFLQVSLMEALELALTTRRAVQGNANPKLSLECFLLGYDRLRKGR